jgi:hypothetical protein
MKSNPWSILLRETGGDHGTGGGYIETALEIFCLLNHRDSMVHILIHLDPPSWSKLLHRPDDRKPTDPANNTQTREQPFIANSSNQRVSDDSTYAAKYISDEVVDRDTTARASGHES